jgi:hypothetical protein
MREIELRKDTFDEANSVPVVLADGQTWFVPKPWLVIRPTFKDGVVVSTYPFLTYSDKLDVLIDAIAEAEDLDFIVSATATLAAYLLRNHYELTDSDLDRLLAYRVGDPASLEWLGLIMETATGRNGKKVARAGGD